MRITFLLNLLLLTVLQTYANPDKKFGYLLMHNKAGTIWWCRGGYKVMRETPLPEVKSEMVFITSAKNEYEPFQIILRPKKDWHITTLSFKQLKHGKSGRLIKSIEICFVDYVHVKMPTDMLCKPGYYPDPLPPLKTPFDAKKGKNQPLWFTIYVPEDADAGVYKGTIIIKTQNSGNFKIPVRLKVWDFTLPEETHTKTAYGVSINNEFYNLKTEEQFKKVYDLHMQNFKEHRVSPYDPMMYAKIKWKIIDRQKVEIDFTEFNKAAQKYLDRYKFNTFYLRALPYKLNGHKRFTEEYNRLVGLVFGKIVRHLKKKGWLKKAYCWWFDEPAPKDYDHVIKGMRLLKEKCPGLKRLLTEQPEPKLYGYVDIWVPVIHRFNRKRVKQRQKAGEEVWWYVCTSPKSPYPGNFIDQPAIYHRIRYWMMEKYNVQGELYWSTTYYRKEHRKLRNPYKQPMSISPKGRPFGNGEGVLLYPPTKDLPAKTIIKGPVNSIRWEMIREGLEDREYFWLLKQLGKAPGPFIDKLVKRRTKFEKDPEKLYRVRRRIARIIQKLSREKNFFRNVADRVGLEGVSAHRVWWVDINNDGWLDGIFKKRKGQIRVFLSKGGKKFVEWTEKSKINQHPDSKNKKRFADFLIFGDVDNDGDIDVFSAKYCNFEQTGKKDDGLRSEILINQNGAFFILKDSGVNKYAETTSAAIFFDYDNDGILDLFVGNWYRFYGKSLEAYQDRLFKGDGNTFVEVTEKAGLKTERKPGTRLSSKPTYGVSCCDWNNDGWQDILVCVYGRQWNFLWKNNGDGTFKDVADDVNFDGDANQQGVYPPEIKRPQEKPFRSNGNTFDVACGDYDNDGDIDVFLSEITHWWAGTSSDLSSLLINQGKEGRYKFLRNTDLIKREHKTKYWNQGDIMASWFDFDNDGLLDLLLASSDYPDGQYLRLFKQKENHTFEDITREAGFNWEGASGISLGDFDRDGDIDILVARSFVRLAKKYDLKGRVPQAGLFENKIGNKNNWINIKLEGTGKGRANRSAIGARVVVKCGGIWQMRELYAGHGHSGHQNAMELHFGLGKSKLIDEIEVIWPDRKHTRQKFKNVKVNQFIKIKQGVSRIENITFSDIPATKRDY